MLYEKREQKCICRWFQLRKTIYAEEKRCGGLQQNSIILGMCLWVIFDFFKTKCNFLLFLGGA